MGNRPSAPANPPPPIRAAAGPIQPAAAGPQFVVPPLRYGQPQRNPGPDRIRQQSAEIDALIDKGVSINTARIFEEIRRVTENNPRLLFDPALKEAFCDRLVLVYSRGFDWFDKEYLKGVGYRLGLIPTVGAQPMNKDQLCQLILRYYTTKYYLALWILEKKEREGCAAVKDVVVANAENVLRGSPENIRREAYRRIGALDDAVYDVYRYIDAAYALIATDISPFQLTAAYNEIVDTLPRYYQRCCQAAQAVAALAWEKVPGGTWKNTVTGATLSVLPSGITTLDINVPVTVSCPLGSKAKVVGSIETVPR